MRKGGCAVATYGKIIEVKDLKKYYNRGAIKALDGVTVDINKGDVVVVIGPSGSGKSTFLRSLNLLEDPTAGSWISTARRWGWSFSTSTSSPT